MKQRLGVIVGVIAAFLVGTFAMYGTASAAGDASSSATKTKQQKKLESNVKSAKKKANKTCKKVKKAKGKKAKKQAKKRCKKAKNNVKKQQKKLNQYKAAQYFDVCKHGCKYRTVQKGADAAGTWQEKTKRKATVRVQPGTYVEGVFLDGRNPNYNYNGLTIMGVTSKKKPASNPKGVILEGENAKTIVDGNPQVANNAIEGRSIIGLVMKNMWARHYQNNTFFVWAGHDGTERCADYTMDNLLSTDTRSYGFFARNCYGGTIENSEGYHHGDSALYVGETPCDSEDWTNRTHAADRTPCQANPDWTVIKNVKSHANVLGYSGTNSKYVEIKDSAFYNNGAGVVPNTLDSEKFEPSGWLKIHDNDIFWNNYNYYSTGSAFQTVATIGDVNYPIGIGVVLYGTDSVQVYDNNIFGNEKWGAATFSGPELFDVNEGSDAMNMNNQFVDNNMGRDGVDPNGNYDFFSDYSGGSNCWQGNTAGSTFAPGNGSVPVSTIYPDSCPQPVVGKLDVQAVELNAGLQINWGSYKDDGDPSNGPGDADTIFGYSTQHPPQRQECSMTVNTPHPAYMDYVEDRADPVNCL
ncbi:MAG: hypothetical protein KDB54_03835 [Solirubrobacterales bacterium]|nr:hypothetical protein [Solirubrobacterales bacterium]HRV59196.1 hypothetical protein [Solirubrobacterales bacterium]